jgi:regulator of sigma E protease
MHLIDIPAIVLILGVLVFIHELGHYLVAKSFGVRVEVFSLGFGKRLFGFRKGDTDYRVSLLPLGGYVKMAGENPMEDRTGDPGEFTSHPRWQRFLIAIAGPTMNIIFTIIVLTVVFKVHNERAVYEDQPAVIGGILDDSAAQASGLKEGDKVVRIQDLSNPTWEQVFYKVLLSPNQPVEIAIQRGNDVVTKTVVPHTLVHDPLGDMGWEPQERTIVRDLVPDFPAAKAGIHDGDEIIALNGKPIHSSMIALLALQKNQEKPLQIAVLRNGQRLEFTVIPQFSDDPQLGIKKYRIGVSLPNETKIQPLSLGGAFNRAIGETRSKSLLVFELVGKLVKGKISIKVLQSPVGMSREAGEAANAGMLQYVAMMAIISLQLGIFNLLPIPILDGGLMLMLLIEGTLRRDINQRLKERAYQVAFVCLILFASVVIFNDVAKGFHH